jgi:hypothetical protein
LTIDVGRRRLQVPPHLAKKFGLKLVVTKRKGEGDSKREITVFALV